MQLHPGTKVEVRPVGAKRWVPGEVYAAAGDEVDIWFVVTSKGPIARVRANDMRPMGRQG
jgi:hypothetical protein